MRLQETKLAHASYPNLDLAKFLCALLVVIIHTDPLEGVSALADFYLNDVIARIAVPVFFAISGFLFFGRLEYSGGRIARTGENLKRLIRTTRKNVLLYLLWSLIYLAIVLPQWYQSGWWGFQAAKDWLHTFLFIGSYYHLWYLLALILAVPALYLLLSVIPMTQIWIVASGLWVLECLVYSYAWLGAGQIPLVEFINTKMPVAFDGLLRALPLLSVGAALSYRQRRAPKAAVCFGAFLLHAAEASALYFFSPNREHYSYLFATPLLTYAILCILIFGKQISLTKKWQYRLRDMSLLIYCLHPMICYLCRLLPIPAGIPFWLTVTVLSVGTAFLWSELKNTFPKGKNQYD